MPTSFAAGVHAAPAPSAAVEEEEGGGAGWVLLVFRGGEAGFADFGAFAGFTAVLRGMSMRLRE
jgi:hypothetical protein